MSGLHQNLPLKRWIERYMKKIILVPWIYSKQWILLHELAQQKIWRGNNVDRDNSSHVFDLGVWPWKWMWTRSQESAFLRVWGPGYAECASNVKDAYFPNRFIWCNIEKKKMICFSAGAKIFWLGLSREKIPIFDRVYLSREFARENVIMIFRC